MKRLRILKPRYLVMAAVALLIILLSTLSARHRVSETVSPIRKDVVDAVFATGHLVMSDEYVVATNKDGFIIDVSVKAGDSVPAGAALFHLSNTVTSSQLATARAQYEDARRKADPQSPSILSLKSQIEQAERQLELERQNLKRYTALVQTNASSQLDYENAQFRFEKAQSDLDVLKQSLTDLQEALNLEVETARNQLRIYESEQDDHLIRSSQPGVVLEIYKEQGELARNGQSLARIGSGDYLARLLVAEEDIRLIRIGQPVKISLNTDRTRVIDARVTTIYPSFDVEDQSFVIEASFNQGDQPLFAGTQLQANIVVAARMNALTIPVRCLQDDSLVTLSNGNVVPVQTGIRSGLWVEVIAGISESDQLQIPEE